MKPIYRRRAIAAGAAAFVSVLRSRPARAAQFHYKASTSTEVDHPIAVRLTQMFEAIRRESNGRLDIALFPNAQLGSESSVMVQTRSNAVQLMVTLSSSFSALEPAFSATAIGFAFDDAAQAEAAFDGPFGDYLRKLLPKHNLISFDKAFDVGMKQITSGTKPVRSAGDLAGFKIRTPPAAVEVDLFRTLGASPTPLDFPEVYTALQTRVIDGQETPYSIIAAARFYEVQRYCSVTNHLTSIDMLVMNAEAWNALPPDLQSILRRNADAYVRLERRDIALQSVALAEKLRRLGLRFNVADRASMRRALSPFYAKWKKQLGDEVWTLLENAARKKLA